MHRIYLDLKRPTQALNIAAQSGDITAIRECVAAGSDELPALHAQDPDADPYSIAVTEYSEYDDVGTSYDLNALWVAPLKAKLVAEGRLTGIKASAMRSPQKYEITIKRSPGGATSVRGATNV